MKNFLIKFACFILLLAVLVGLIGQYYAVNSPIAEEFQHPVSEMPQSVELAVIGSSHALYGIDLSVYSDSYFNFSMSGQTPAYDYMVLREYEDRIADGATILMTVSYFSPFWTEPDGQFTEKQTRYYRMLSSENILNYDPAEDFRIKMSEKLPFTRLFYTETPVLLQTVFDSLKRDLDNFFRSHTQKVSAAEADPELLSQEIQPDTPVDPSYIPAWYQDLDRYRDIIKHNHLSLIEPTFPEMNVRMAEAYSNIFALAEKHNWKIIAVTTPFIREYNQLFDEEFFSVYYDHLDTLFEGHVEEFWDYSHDSRFADTPAYFMDLDHLEVEGQKFFSKILAYRLGLVD